MPEPRLHLEWMAIEEEVVRENPSLKERALRKFITETTKKGLTKEEAKSKLPTDLHDQFEKLYAI
jgi:hypothetical protein